MNARKHSQISQKFSRWLLAFALGACWAYALVVRWSSFMIASRTDKIIILLLPLILTTSLAAWLFHELLPKLLGPLSIKDACKPVLASLLAALMLLLLFYQVPPFPEQHQLKITPSLESDFKQVEVLSIHRRELPGGQMLEVPPGNLEIIGGWQKKSFNNTLVWRGDPEAYLGYARFMQAGIEVVFRSGPQQGGVMLEWDGEVQHVNLNVPAEGLQSLYLPPAFDLRRADLMRKFLLGLALLSELASLTFFILISTVLINRFLVKKTATLRAAKIVLACIVIFLFLLPLSSWINPPAQFEDAHLEAAVREALAQPDGVIRQNMLRTIAELDASQRNITSLVGIQQLRNLITLNLNNNLITDISPLSQLQRLQELNLRANAVRDLSPLASLRHLTYLNLHSNLHIQSILPLQDLRNLRTLILAHVTVGDEIETLSHLTNLTYLNLRNSQVDDISALGSLGNLTYLNLHSNPNIDSIDTLSKLTGLETLILANVPVGPQTDVIKVLPSLKQLNLRNCAIQDVTFLLHFLSDGENRDQPRTWRLNRLDIRDNPVPITEKDGYALIRADWEKIANRAPLALPDHHSLPAPVFSQPAGFYEEPFLLELTAAAPGASIYYTLDGSEPTLSSARYEKPLWVASRKGTPDTYAIIENTSPQWQAPEGELFKGNIVRARVFDQDGQQKSPIVTHTFFVDENIFQRYSLPVVSMVSQPENFFDSTSGIYVMGDIWDINYGKSDVRWLMHPANYHQAGFAWERPVHIELFEPGGKLGFSQNGGVRIHGGETRSYRQKGLRLYADIQYDEADSFGYDFFRQNKNPSNVNTSNRKSIILRNSGSDWASTMFRDAMTLSLTRHFNVDAQAYQPVVLFINGEYWGIHNLRDRIDPIFFANHHGLDPQKIEIYDFPTDIFHYADLLVFTENHDLSDPQNYEHIKKLMDVDNFIDYLITEIYSRNTDWPQNNVRFWRYQTDNDQPDAPNSGDGRWRWILYDLDAGFGTFGEEPTYAHNTLYYALTANNDYYRISFIFRSLLQNTLFRQQFISRFADHMNTSFQPQRVIQVIDDMQSAIAPAMPEHIRRWRTMDDSMRVWEQNVDVMRTFALNRPEFVRQHIIEYFDLPGTARITLQADPSMGHIRINTTDIISSTPAVQNPKNWSGIYFQGVPVSLTAVPKPGFQFIGWEGIDQSAIEIELLLEHDMTLKAQFAPLESETIVNN